MKMNIKLTAVAASLALVSASAFATGPGNGSAPYEVWAADQSNSVAGVASRGVSGSYLWIWDGKDVGNQIKGKSTAVPTKINLYDAFDSGLVEMDTSGPTGETLGSSPKFGRLHGMIADPQQKYMNINSFVPGGGYVGIMDGATKEAIALFRVTQTNAALSGSGRSLHMSFWNNDGSALLLANLHGRILERIDITRDADGNITNANYNLGASLNVGGGLTSIADEATAFTGPGMVSTVSGSYDAVAALGATTPSGAARQGAERPVNVIVCPIVTSNNNVYITFGGGGLLVADGDNTPMNIVAEYDRANINGAGCGGVQSGDYIYLNAGASAAGSGATQSTMTIYAIDDAEIEAGNGGVNTPAPIVIYRDTDATDGNAANTATIGATDGDASNATGQLPGISTRRDAHGMAITNDGRYIHQADRIQNNIEVIDTASMTRIGTYDLTSANGQGAGMGPCDAASVSDDPGLPTNDPAPDLMGTTPDGKYLVVATRGPTPVSVSHNAQGSCPGVGIIKLSKDGDSGKLVTVLRTTNTLDTAPQSAPGGHAYTGTEHSDPHGASVRIKVEEM
ncbi:MAG: hypothetical protein KAJ32_05460 [Gammaproteobacteria bacterium]|nr:hypothetical protein [Gammaproteobacteria bacterium]